MKEIMLTAPETISRLTVSRRGESKVGDVITCGDCGAAYPDLDLLANYLRHSGTRYVLVGIPEDIGIRANGGRPGAHEGWKAFLSSFLNLQANQFLQLKNIHVLGEVRVHDLMEQSINKQPEELRALCSEIDMRVSKVISALYSVDLVPIVIGGGHNNAFGILKGIGKPSGVINIDPHLDFRALEGRHSGNAFSYAYASELLSKYFVLGMHEQSNSQEMLDRFLKAGFMTTSYDDLAIRKTRSLDDSLEDAYNYFGTESVGLEIDLDSIPGIPSSAESIVGFRVEEVLYVMNEIASRLKISYLHLTEGSPSLGNTDGARIVGKILSAVVSTFLKASKGRQ